MMLAERQSGLVIVGRFYYLHEADIARALLESFGIEAWLLDEHQIRQRWFLGGALGGIKLAVAPENGYRARCVLEEDRSGVLDSIDEQALPAHPDECCPRCDSPAASESTTQQLPGPFQWLVSIFFLAIGLLVPRRRFVVTRACGACGYEWSTTESR